MYRAFIGIICTILAGCNSNNTTQNTVKKDIIIDTISFSKPKKTGKINKPVEKDFDFTYITQSKEKTDPFYQKLSFNKKQKNLYFQLTIDNQLCKSIYNGNAKLKDVGKGIYIDRKHNFEIRITSHPKDTTVATANFHYFDPKHPNDCSPYEYKMTLQNQ